MKFTFFYGIPWKAEFNDLLEDFNEYPENYGFTPLIPIIREKEFKIKNSHEEFIGYCGIELGVLDVSPYTYQKFPSYLLSKDSIKEVQNKINALPEKLKILIDSEINTIGIYCWGEN